MLVFRSLPQITNLICPTKITGNDAYGNKHCLFWKPKLHRLILALKRIT